MGISAEGLQRRIEDRIGREDDDTFLDNTKADLELIRQRLARESAATEISEPPLPDEQPT